MNSKNLFLVYILSVFTLSFNAYSQESIFCADPIKTVCVDLQKKRSIRYNYIENLKIDIRLEAEKNAKLIFDTMVSEMRGPFKTDRQTYNYSKTLDKEIIKSAKSRISSIESIVTDPKYISMFKSYMKQAIDESHFNQSTKIKFKSIIDSIIIGNYVDYIEKSRIGANFTKQLKKTCGLDGMKNNAVFKIINRQKYIFICPGMMITISKSASEEEKVEKILHIITHEMAHYITNLELKYDTYEPFLACISKNYTNHFKKKLKDEKFCNKKSNIQNCDIKIVDSHAKELISDQWANKVIAIYAKSKRYSTYETDSLIMNSLSGVCDNKDEGIHPSGDFRIGTLLRLNPDISDYLLCNNSEIEKPSCTFDGEVNL